MKSRRMGKSDFPFVSAASLTVVGLRDGETWFRSLSSFGVLEGSERAFVFDSDLFLLSGGCSGLPAGFMADESKLVLPNASGLGDVETN